MKLKPIEPGCLAIITHSRAGNTGRVVRVIRYIGEVDGFPSTPDRWEIDTWINTTNGEGCNHHPGKWLMRIDGDDFSHEEREEAEEIRHNLLKFEYLVGKMK